MKVLIDADGCPVLDITIKIAKEHGLECLIICDSAHFFEKEGATTITVSKGPDSVDFRLVNLVEKGDIVVTQDYGLAAMCLAKKAFPINQNGLIFKADNIDALLMQRHKAAKIRQSGGRLRGPAKRTSEDDEIFAKNLQKLIAQV